MSYVKIGDSSSNIDAATYIPNTFQRYQSNNSQEDEEIAPEFIRQQLDKDNSVIKTKNQIIYGKQLYFIFLTIFVLFGVIAYASSSSSSIGSGTLFSNLFQETTTIAGTASTTTTTSGTTLSLYIKASNEYGQFTGSYPWLDEATGSQLVEPYKTSTIQLKGEASTNDYIWKWSTSYDDEVYYGLSVEKVFQVPGVYTITVEGMDHTSDNNVMVTFTTSLICKYVKRELRALTSSDQKAFLKAAHKIWKYSNVEGQALYGPKFTSAAKFVEEHSLASNDVRCDQFHEGSGFFTHHFAMTQSFEASLRAVDPSVTLPYWDFTIEGQQIEDANESPSYFLQVTPFLTSDWFGSTDADGHIQDSLFAHSQMPKVSSESIVTPNSYGYIRSYWNNNNDDEVVRHLFDVCGVEPTKKTMPTCSSHYDLLNTKSLAKFQILSPSDGHGPVHVQIGGIGGDCVEGYKTFTSKWSTLLNADMTTEEIVSLGYDPKDWDYGLTATRKTILEDEVMSEYYHSYRSLWRSHMCSRDNTPNLLECPESCDDDQSASKCKCQVTSLVDGTTDWENVEYCVLSDKNRYLFSKVFGDEFTEDLVRFVATTSIIEGEMLEAASPADIIFWVIHPTIERVLAAKRVEAGVTFGNTAFTRFDTIDGSEEEWYSYSYYSLEEGENKYYTEAYTCTGHAADDAALPASLPWLDGFEAYADTDGNGVISNYEYYLALNPNDVNGVDYVFDNFEWSHCDGKISTYSK